MIFTERGMWIVSSLPVSSYTGGCSYGNALFCTRAVIHMIGFSDLVDFWVMKVKKKPMILCARSMSRSREQRTKCRSSSENTWKVCLFYSQNNKVVWLSNMTDTFFEKFAILFPRASSLPRQRGWKFARFAKVCGLFSWLCFWDADWLGEQIPITWIMVGFEIIRRLSV